MIVKNTHLALDGVAQWIELVPANRRVTGSIPSQGIPSCRLDPQEGAHERQPHIDVSPPPSLPSKNKQTKS